MTKKLFLNPDKSMPFPLWQLQ